MVYDRIFEFYYELTQIPNCGIYDEAPRESFYFYLDPHIDINKPCTMYFGMTYLKHEFFGLEQDATIETCLNDYFKKYIERGYSDFRTLGLTSFDHVALNVLMSLQMKYPHIQYGTTREFAHFLPLIPYYKKVVYNILKERELLNIYSKYLFNRNAKQL